tara:strand:+ start:1367 stop:2779 length:1413 start_codon:yes stop_codon:yes gene_type:complete
MAEHQRSFQQVTLKTVFYPVILVSLLASVSGCSLVRDLGVGKGFSAKYLCSSVFNSGMAEEKVIEDFIKPKVRQLPWFWRVDVDRDTHQVSVGDIFTGQRGTATAIYTAGKGCTLLVGKTREDVESLPFTPSSASASAEASDAEWPLGERVAPVTAGDFDTDALDKAVAGMFEEKWPSALNTTSVLVVHKGRIVAEAYDNGATADTPLLGWSMTKSVTGMLIGILIDQGRLDLDGPAPIPQWQGTDKAAITPRQLLNMASGIENNENYKGLSDVSQMLYLESDQLSFAAGQALVHEPGTVFDYSTPEANRLAAILRSVLGGQQAVYDFYQNELFHKLGIYTGFIEFDASGGMVGGAYGYLTTRDWAKLGLLYLNDGIWDGERVFTAHWMRFALAPSPAAGHYGAQLWINTDGERWYDLPEDIFYFMGHQGQRVIMVPSKDLVIVRTGVTEDYELQKQAISEFLHQVIAAF